METQDLILYGVAGLAFVAVAGAGLALAGGSSSETAAKRARQYQQRQRAGNRKADTQDEVKARRRQTQQMLKTLRNENQPRKGPAILPQDIKSRMQQAGIEAPASAFWIASLLMGVALAILAYLSGANGFTWDGVDYRSQPLVVTAAGLAGGIGLPRWILGMMIKARRKKLTGQFADAIDIIVRGVKSGLPLNECLQIIGRESAEPLGREFRDLSSNLKMGNTLEQALRKFYKRVAIPEVNFFITVLNIQSKSGGNLSEALGNLSSVIRARRMMREKIKAMSSEAKASAGIIAALPFAVTLMVYFTTPDYITLLFTESTGHLILALGALLMFVGVMVMRRMISFDI